MPIDCSFSSNALILELAISNSDSLADNSACKVEALFVRTTGFGGDEGALPVLDEAPLGFKDFKTGGRSDPSIHSSAL